MPGHLMILRLSCSVLKLSIEIPERLSAGIVIDCEDLFHAPYPTKASGFHATPEGRKRPGLGAVKLQDS